VLFSCTEALNEFENMKTFASKLILVASIVSLVWMAGCGSSGPERHTVAGTVTLDGSPIEEGTITFVPIEGGNGGSGEITDGAYKLEGNSGLVVAEYKVEVYAMKKTGKKVPGAGPDGMIDEAISIIPPKFNANSSLKATVVEGENTLDFDLKLK